jgi:hypothetical protein
MVVPFLKCKASVSFLWCCHPATTCFMTGSTPLPYAVECCLYFKQYLAVFSGGPCQVREWTFVHVCVGCDGCNFISAVIVQSKVWRYGWMWLLLSFCPKIQVSKHGFFSEILGC